MFKSLATIGIASLMVMNAESLHVKAPNHYLKRSVNHDGPYPIYFD